MFVKAIQTAGAFTRPIRTIGRFYGSKDVIPGTATLFFVNKDGWALTCAHVARQLILTDKLFKRFNSFKDELREVSAGKKGSQTRRALEQKYGIRRGKLVELHSSFTDCLEGNLNFEIKVSKEADIALLKFYDFNRLLCSEFPVFAKDHTSLQPGKFLCRLGFPFPEFTNFKYDVDTEQIEWTQEGRVSTPRFPIEGMVTRHLLGKSGKTIGFELSAPGLRGQSGGPAFDSEGIIWGMQALTQHLDLDFDVDMEVLRDGKKKKLSESAILHVGHCIQVGLLKDFMRSHGVAFKEA